MWYKKSEKEKQLNTKENRNNEEKAKSHWMNTFD